MSTARKPSAERRTELLEAAVQVISRRGFAGATTREIAAEAGVQQGLLHHYFPSRDDLLASAFAHHASQEQDACDAELAAAGDPVARLRVLVDVPNRDDPGVRLWLDAWSEAPRVPALAEIVTVFNDAWTERLVTAFRDGDAQGSFRCPDPERRAWATAALLDGTAVQGVMVDEASMESRRAVVRGEIEHALGLGPGTLDPQSS